MVSILNFPKFLAYSGASGRSFRQHQATLA
jgi:hypothetical protein